MSRRAIALAALAVTAVAAVWGCQDYNFNPVGSCIIQPGQKQVTLADVSTADILFVVDDSGSMDSKQADLALNFQQFIDSLVAFNVDRVQNQGLEPFDFHIAVTNSSIFVNTTGTPRTTYDFAAGACGAQTTCTVGTTTGCTGGQVCKYLSGTSGPTRCCTLSCTPGLATDYTSYPAGNFVSKAPNPKVLHFDKALFTPTVNTAAVNALVAQFRDNILVGSCGSGQEQHLESGRLAVQKALAGQQSGVAPGEWPHPNAKMVVVWVGDEDDCSNPQNLILSGGTGNDSCVADRSLPPAQQKLFPVSDYDAFFAATGRPFGAAFIVSANRCTTARPPRPYEPADSTFVQSPASCTGTPMFACSVAFAAGVRLLQLADNFRARSYDVVEGSVCENFGPILSAIADLVKAPSALRLPSLPAASEITVVRTVKRDGTQKTVCAQETTPGPVPSPATAGDWWFMDCGDRNPVPAVSAAVTTCIYINHATSSCEVNPGETYSAEYLGRLPEGGCSPASPTKQPSPACAQALVGPSATPADEDAWWCFGAAGGTGTCICSGNVP